MKYRYTIYNKIDNNNSVTLIVQIVTNILRGQTRHPKKRKKKKVLGGMLMPLRTSYFKFNITTCAYKARSNLLIFAKQGKKQSNMAKIKQRGKVSTTQN